MTVARALLALLAVAALGVGGWLLTGGGDPGEALDPGDAARAPSSGGPVTDQVPLIPVHEGGGERAPGREGDGTPASDGRLRALLVDRATNEPVPHYELELRRDGPGMRTYALRSDADGWFESTGIAEAGAYSVTLIDYPGDPARPHFASFVHPGDRLEIPVGPTFRIETELPPGYHAEHFRVHITSRLGFADAPTTAPLRENDEYWVRFPPLESYVVPGAFSMRLSSTDDRWRSPAVAPDWIRGVHPTPIALPLHQIGNLAVTVRTTDDAFVTEGTYELVPAPGVSVPAIEFQTSGNLTRGRIQFVGAPATEWLLKIDSPRHETWSGTVQVVGGESTEEDVTLELLPIAGDVTGILSSDTGRHTETLAVRLAGWTDPRRRFKASVRWMEEEGRRIGRFRFKDVPTGRYELALETHDWWRWEPEHVDVVPPMDGIEIVCRDAAGTTGVGFSVFDAGTKEKLHSFTIDLRNATGSVFRLSRVPSGLVFLREFPTNAAAMWTIELDGYQSVTGTEEDFDERRQGLNGEALFADVYLEKDDG